jgi:hypothetical protein
MKDEDSQFFRVNLNGYLVDFDGPNISYEKIVRKSYRNAPEDLSGFDYLVTVNPSKSAGTRGRVLSPGQSVEKFDGMFIHCQEIPEE